MYSRIGKRMLDLLITVPGILFLSPLMLLIAIFIRCTQGSPIIYCQKRPGQQGKAFEIYKFCSMSSCCDENGCLLPDSQRLTRLGKFLRSTSLDELPELINVIKGDMSLVGPRPLLMQYLDRYTPEQARRHEVKPGITGWAQVNGRNAITWEDKFKLDVWYVDNMSLWLDLKIIAMTLWKIIRREGISQPGHATVEYFQGSQEQNLNK